MLKQFKLDWKLNQKSFLLTLLFYPAMFLVGIGMLALILWLDDEPSGWFPMGTIMAIMLTPILSIVGGVFYPQSFNLSLSMGRTRRDFMVSYALRQILWLLCGYILILILNRIEMTVLPALLGGYSEDEMPMDFLTDWRIIVPVIAALVLLHMFIGSLFSRFGKIAGLVLYVVWMAVCLGLPRLLHEGSPFLALIQAIPTAGWIAIGIAALAAMLIFVIYQGRNQTVR